MSYLSHTLLWRVENLLQMLTNYLEIKTMNKTQEELYGDILINENESIALRMRTCFELKSINNESAINELNRGLLFSKSSLLKHEIAYVLGQMRNKYAIKYLINVLENLNEETIVRHECCEALGAIADINDIKTIEIIKKYCNDKCIEIAQTAQLALQCIKLAQNNQKIKKSKYNSVDPAPPYNDINDLEKLKNIYLSETHNLFERYRAMFTLRDIGSDKALEILCLGLNDKKSALFRHEVAFVLGQVGHNIIDNGIDQLSVVLKNKNESSMVRHEAAEALGAIAKDKCKTIIKQHLNDEEIVVKESCIVADDMYTFWTT